MFPSTYKIIDIVCVKETQFDLEILDAEIQIEGYTIFRKDRDFLIDLS